MNASQWARPVSPEEAARRAAGRKRINARRQRQAARRRCIVHRLLFVRGRLLEKGIKTKLARKLGVSWTTIDRDIKYLLALGHPCKACGAFVHETIRDPFDDSPSANPKL